MEREKSLSTASTIDLNPEQNVGHCYLGEMQLEKQIVTKHQDNIHTI